ncbi:MAG: hypothetical protein ACI9J3_004113 [Parvicellaceae bacterium]|jgi:hypothetical protein
MNMRFIVLLAILFSSAVYGQAANSYGFKLTGGASKVNSNESVALGSQVVSWAPSGAASIFFQLKIGKRGLFGIEGGAGQIEGKSTTNVDVLDGASNIIGNSSTLSRQHLTYLQVPIYGGFTLNNASFYLGPQLGIAVNSFGKQETTTTISGSEEITSSEPNLNVATLDYGAKIGLILKVSKKISLEASYYHGIANILDDKSSGSTTIWNNRQILIGARFAIRNTNDCGSCPMWN